MNNLALDPFKVAQVSDWESASHAMNLNDKTHTNLIKAYRLFKRMMDYPDMMSQMRAVFLEALEKESNTSRDTVRHQALRILKRSGSDDPDESAIHEIIDVLIDFRFSTSFSPAKIESHINFARKQAQFSRLVHVINQEGATYGKIKKELLRFCDIPEGEIYIPSCEAEGARVGLINYFISCQVPFNSVAKQHITIRDIGEIARSIVRTNRRPGKIGGKSAGMVLAHKILVPRLEKRDPELEKYIRIPESWCINTGVFSDFIARNKLYHLHAQKYKAPENIEKDYGKMSDIFKKATFSCEVMEKFRTLLVQIGEHPIVLRSSSLLENNFKVALPGKYDSVFLANQGDIDTRLKEFVTGLKKVHMSTSGPAPLIYRKDNNLLDFDEKMSVLVQKVVGRQFGKYFFPFVSGVGHSYSSYSWTPQINKNEGLMRLVMGLGTRAVDRVGEDCPRMVHLGNLKLRPETTADKIEKYSQKIVDVLNLETGKIESKSFIALMSEIDHPDLFFAASENQYGNISTPVFKDNTISINRSCITFDNLLSKTCLPKLMTKVLKKLDQAYGCPVDVEFVWDGDHLFIVQCKPLATAKTCNENADISEDMYKGLLFFKNGRVVSAGSLRDLEYLVYVNPEMYESLSSSEDKKEISRVVSRINRKMAGKPYALFGPGRWGSCDADFGVGVGYADINNASVIGEVGSGLNDSICEVSYGTHFFTDLLESGIMHVSFAPGEKDCFFQDRVILNSQNHLASFVPDDTSWESVVHLIHIPSCLNGMKLQIVQDSRQQKGIGFFC